MKKLNLFLLTLSVVFMLLVVFNVSLNAQESADIDFEVQSGSIDCYHDDFSLGTINASTGSQMLTGESVGRRGCVDLQGISSGSFQVTMGTSITNGITNIDDENVTIIATNLDDDCSNTVNVSSGTLDGTVDLMQKTVATDLCSYSVLPELEVEIPAQATVGTYSGVITVTYPN